MNTLNKATPLKTNEYPLKIDGWKMKFPLNMVPLQGRHSRIFGGGMMKLYGHLGFYDFQVAGAVRS